MQAGRLKLNGHVLGYSPLSCLEELELSTLGVTGKRALWQTLHLLARHESRPSTQELERLIGRAEAQLEMLEACRRTAVFDALSPELRARARLIDRRPRRPYDPGVLLKEFKQAGLTSALTISA